MCKSAKNTFSELGVEVYEIGARQCRELFGWPRSYETIGVLRVLLNRANCYTMRKGAWLVAVSAARFGRQPKCVDLYGDGTVCFAANEVEWFQICDRSYLSSRANPWQHHVEVWHLVDDDELWGDWERRVLDSHSLISEDATVEYEWRSCGSSYEYLTGVWVPEVGHYVTVNYTYPNYEVRCVDDWQGIQPVSFTECEDYGWMPWPMDEILEVDLPCSYAELRILDETGYEYSCTDVQDVRETLGTYHMLPLCTELNVVYGYTAGYSPIAVVKVHACTL